ncbi:glycerophosphoryl diester phosphodiesterase membrane domain-containing protein [Streptomonospora alba]|uniref:glycerophosphoryl diester phosphodiesterase membrane domain-containing protein n=1 Tax=Streptomonospora alba TaxID=183763 RepID=UPI000B1783A7|nr:glycerophosphoryl diester phosphodiesterase membrane domain-containing protein [Streptomonospora alba]
MTLGDIYNGAFGYIRQNPKATLGLALIVTALFSIVSSIGMGGYLADYGRVMQETLDDPSGPAAGDPTPFELWSIVTMYAGILVSYIGQIVLTGLLAAVVGLAVLGRRPTMREALQVARGRLPAVFGVALLLLLLILLWTALAVGLIFGAVLLGTAVHPVAGVVTGVLGVPALIVLAVWIYVRTSLAMPVAVLERAGPASALARSWRLTHHSWWRVFGLLLLAQILVSIVVNLLSTPFTGAAMVLAFIAPESAWAPAVATALAYVGTVLAGALGTPFVIGVTTLLYIDLRMRREGLDLKLQAATQSGEHLDAEVYVPDEAAAGAPAGSGSYGQSGGYTPPGGDPYYGGGAYYGGAQPGTSQSRPQDGHGWGGYGQGGPGTSA